MEHFFLIPVVALAFLFAFINGFHDGSNVIAASVLSRSLTPRKAISLACAAEFVGALLLGTAVATTIGKEIIDPASLHSVNRLAPTLLLLAGLISALTWNIMTWWIGLAPSSSHALIGGLLGGAIAAYGLGVVNWGKLLVKVFVVLLISPAVGILLGYLIMAALIPLLERSRPDANDFSKRIQLVSLLFLGASHGSNNAQKAMGVITMLLVASGSLGAFKVPGWVVLGCAAALTLGVSAGGRKIVKIMGDKIFKIEPIHAFGTQLSAGSVVFAASLCGGPVSTTQIVKSSILGVGAGSRSKDVHWIVIKDMMIAWLITVPASAFLAAVIYCCISGAMGEGMGCFEDVMKLFGQ